MGDLVNLPNASQCPPPTPAMSFGMPGVSQMKIYPWQDSSTCNITNISMVAQANMSTTIQNDAVVSQSNTFFVDAGGDINFDGDYFNQTNDYSLKAMQAAFVSNSAQQTMALSMLQQASSTAKGLAITPQSAQATNVINANMKTTVNMSTNVSQTCNGSQSNSVTLKAGGNVNIKDSYLSQSNDATMTCMQATLTKNVSMQSLSAQLEQAASATAIGIPVWAFCMIIIAFVACAGVDTYAFISNESAGVIITGIVILLIGLGLFGNSFRYDKEQAIWMGFSPGIKNAETACAGMYRTDVELWHANSTDAQNILMDKKKGKTFAAFDWTPDPDGVGGTAQWYKYASTGTISTKSIAEKCPSIINSSSDTSNKLISMRPDAYLNVALAGKVPDISIVGDLLLDIDTGNLWVRMPPGFDTCTPSTYGGAEGAPWIFVEPKKVNMSNVNNVYKQITGCTGCSSSAGTCCTSGCAESPITDLISSGPIDTSKSKVYIYIDPSPNRLLNYNLDSTHSYGYGTYSSLLSEIPTLKGQYTWDYTSPVGNKTLEAKIGPDDYFLVVFPYGPTSNTPYFSNSTAGTWPDAVASNFETYDFGQSFMLYKAIPDDPKSKTPNYVPFMDATIPPPPVNVVPGLGPSVEVQGFTSTCFKSYNRSNKLATYIYAAVMGVGLLIIGIGIFMSFLKSKPQPGANTNAAAGLGIEVPNEFQIDSAIESAAGQDTASMPTSGSTGTEVFNKTTTHIGDSQL